MILGVFSLVLAPVLFVGGFLGAKVGGTPSPRREQLTAIGGVLAAATIMLTAVGLFGHPSDNAAEALDVSAALCLILEGTWFVAATLRRNPA